jgi:tetratricopeptide (TPR) repeat protein
LLHRPDHYAGSIAIGLNFNLLERCIRGADLQWVEPVGANGLIEYRLVSRDTAPAVTACFERRFGKEAFDWRVEPAVKARKFARDGNEEAALSWFREALRRQPRNWYLLWETGALLLNSLRDSGAALALAAEAAAINPIEPSIHLLRARCFSQQGLLTEAAEAARQAVGLDPGNVDAMLVLVEAFRRGGRYAEGLSLIAAAHSIDAGRHCREPLLAEQQRILDALASRAALRDRPNSRFAGGEHEYR